MILSLGIAVVSLGFVAATLRDRRTPIEHLVNSDFLSPATIYQDFKDGYPVHKYQFSAALFTFPDVVLYALVKPFIGDVMTAVLIWEGALYLLLVAAAAVVGRSLCRREERGYVAPAYVCWGALYLLESFRRFVTPLGIGDLLWPVSHNGAQVCAFLAATAAVRLVRTRDGERSRASAGFLTLIACAATFSDRFFVLFFVAPLTLTLGVMAVVNGDRGFAWKAARAIAAVAVGVVCGAVSVAIVRGDQDPARTTWGGFHFSQLFVKVWWFTTLTIREIRAGNLLALSSVLWGAYCVMGLIRASLNYRKDGTKPRDVGMFSYQLFWVAQMGIAAAAYLGGRVSDGAFANHFEWPTFSRYFCGPTATAYFGWAFVFAKRAACLGVRGSAGFLVPTAACLGSLLLFVKAPPAADRSFADLRPELVKSMDEACEQAGVHEGLGDYWAAVPISCLSRKDVRVRHVIPSKDHPIGFAPYIWLGNPSWYERSRDGSASHFEFVIVGKYAAEQVKSEDLIRTLGEPAQRISVHSRELFIYNRPHDEPLHAFGRRPASMWTVSDFCRRMAGGDQTLR